MTTRHFANKLFKVGFALHHDRVVLTSAALRRSADNIIDLVSMMGRASKMPCFSSGVLQTTNLLRQRFQLQLSADEAERYVEMDLIGKSLGSYYTRL
jgi:phosphatidylinositol kinase/protein kinase (PI-3  family)